METEFLSWRELAMGALSVAATAISLWAKSQFSTVDRRIDDLIERLDKRDTEAAADRAAASNARQAIYDKLDATNRTVNLTAVKVGRLEGRAGLKHNDDYGPFS